MNRFRLTLLAAAVTVGLPAFAAAQEPPRDGQHEGHDHDGDHGDGHDHGQAQAQQAQAQAQQAQQHQHQQARQAQQEHVAQQQQQQQREADFRRQADHRDGQHYGAADYRRDQQRQDQAHDGYRGDDRNRDGQHYGSADYRRDQARSDNGGRGFDRGDARPGGDWRRDRRYDWHGYRDAHRDVFRGGRYAPPREWRYGYRRFDVGFRLPPFFFAQNYWIGDPGFYRLPPAYGPYRWVRYYDDVLLVDLRSGVVVDSVPGFFL